MRAYDVISQLKKFLVRILMTKMNYWYKKRIYDLWKHLFNIHDVNLDDLMSLDNSSSPIAMNEYNFSVCFSRRLHS